MGLVQDIKAQKWTYAKTYAKTAPHEYFLHHQNPELFKALAAKIERSGVDEAFYSRTFRYLYLGAYKYWRYDNVLNRTKIKGYTDKEKRDLLYA